MLPLEEVIAFIEARLATGETDLAAIEDAAVEAFRDRVDVEGAIRALLKRRVSLAVVRMQDDDGERVAFAVRDEDGNRRLAHMQHEIDRKLWLRVSAYHAKKSAEHKHISDRAYKHAMQIDLFAPAA